MFVLTSAIDFIYNVKGHVKTGNFKVSNLNQCCSEANSVQLLSSCHHISIQTKLFSKFDGEFTSAYCSTVINQVCMASLSILKHNVRMLQIRKTEPFLMHIAKRIETILSNHLNSSHWD